MNKLLTRGGIEIIAVFIGISGGLWSEKQIELNKTIKAEKVALKSIRDEFVSDSTSLFNIVKSIENEQINSCLSYFQNSLSEIPKWNQITITEKYEKILENKV